MTITMFLGFSFPSSVLGQNCLGPKVSRLSSSSQFHQLNSSAITQRPQTVNHQSHTSRMLSKLGAGDRQWNMSLESNKSLSLLLLSSFSTTSASSDWSALHHTDTTKHVHRPDQLCPPSIAVVRMLYYIRNVSAQISQIVYVGGSKTCLRIRVHKWRVHSPHLS